MWVLQISFYTYTYSKQNLFISHWICQWRSLNISISRGPKVHFSQSLVTKASAGFVLVKAISVIVLQLWHFCPEVVPMPVNNMLHKNWINIGILYSYLIPSYWRTLLLSWATWSSGVTAVAKCIRDKSTWTVIRSETEISVKQRWPISFTF